MHSPHSPAYVYELYASLQIFHNRELQKILCETSRDVKALLHSYGVLVDMGEEERILMRFL